MSTTPDFPRKIYAELTTRCNLQCSMCVKYTKGSCIPEEDMSLTVFDNIVPALPTAETLILNGIGESLLHPQLDEIIGLASSHMPKGSTIGLQSNGLLVNREKAENMLEAGLTTICLSVDRFDDPSKKSEKGSEHSFRAVQRAVEIFCAVRNETQKPFQIGLEIVLTRQTIGDLPGLVNWAADNGIEYILTSHLIPYDRAAVKENLFNPHPPEALGLFAKYRQIASTKNIDFNRELLDHRRSAGTQSAALFSKLMGDMLEEAKINDIQLNFDDLHAYNIKEALELQKILDEVERLGTGKGVDIFIPPLQALSQRECRFIQEKSVFIGADGEVMPCHFLWHTYCFQLLDYDALVNKRTFGSVAEASLLAIWNSTEFREFRREAELYDYTNCQTCPQGPCLTLINGERNFANDCYGSQVPCGHCQWNLGGLRCL